MRHHDRAGRLSRVGRVIAMIEADPGAKHTLLNLAAHANYSPYHFLRVYQSIKGETIGATIRRARLKHAATLLASAPLSIVAVALDAGYESPQAFARAFRGFSGTTPSAYRRQSKTKICPPDAH